MKKPDLVGTDLNLSPCIFRILSPAFLTFSSFLGEANGLMTTP
ncbi:MAG: hypothetical protein ETSY1_25325 [Candidatus Entotheonella factor]|uniref:Uncharacterized protein n=1 Tax=Entotheonella factor TaxID=1429438 RepID=W4LFT7_ENTF1|nr:MAG: hypothetical protein ETSY1_25325 [Candidatus Entotheonella factor]